MARRQSPINREAQLAAEIRGMESLAKAAEKALSFSAAVQARSRLTTMKSEMSRLVEERLAETEADPLVRVRRLRRLAAEAGSWVAAAGLLRQEQEIVEAREAVARAAEEAANADRMTDAEKVRALVEAVRSLPEVLQAQVVRGIGAIS